MPKGKNLNSWKDVANNAVLKLISTGQISLIGLFVLLAIMTYKTPADQIVEVWRVLAQMLDYRSGLGYSLALVCGLSWVLHAKYQRRRAERELDRVSRERNDAQQKHFEKPLRSSKK